MIRLVLICIFFCTMLLSHAQQNAEQPPSELILTLRKSNPDTIRLQLLLQLARKYYFEQSSDRKTLDSVLIFLQQARQLSSEIQSMKFQPEIFCYLAKYCYMTGNVQAAEDYDSKVIEFIAASGPVNNQIARWRMLAWNIAVFDSVGLTRINCFEKMRSLYKESSNSEKEIEMQREIADTHMKQGKLKLAEAELLQVLNKYKSIGFQNLHYTYNLIAVTNRLKGNYDKALHYALLTVQSMQKTNDTGAILNFYGHLAYLYHELGKTEKSVEHYKRFFEIDHHTYYDFYYFRAASFYVSDLIKLDQKEEARRFLIKFSTEYPPGDQYSKAILAKTFADYYMAVQRYSLADKYIQEMINLEGSLGKNNEVKWDIEYYIGQYYFGKKQFGRAAIHFEDALHEAILNNSANAIKTIHLMLFKTDSSLGRYVSAIGHLNQFRQLHDSIFAEAKIKEVEEIQIRYETEKKEQDIKLLEQESKLHKVRLSEASITRNWILGGTGLLLVIVALLVQNTRHKQRTNKKLEQQQREIAGQNISLRHLVHEKEWLLKEVHHRVKNNLQIVMSLLNTQSSYLESDPARKAIQESQDRIYAISLIHQKLYKSEDSALINIREYVHELAEHVKNSFHGRTRVVFEVDVKDFQLDVAQAVPLGLILNEAMSNSIKYAFTNQASGRISIFINQSNIENEFLLTIADDGIGLPADSHLCKPSFGIRLMQGLSKQMGGSFSIQSKNGVRIEVSFKDIKVTNRIQKDLIYSDR